MRLTRQQMLILTGGMFLGVGFAALRQQQRYQAASAVVFHPSDPSALASTGRPKLVEFYRDT